MTDLNLLVPEETHTFQIKHPITFKPLFDADGKPMTATVYSPFSDKFKRIAHEQAKKRISKAKKDKELGYDELDEFTLEMMADSLSDWYVVFDGKPLEFSKDNAKALFKKLPWFLEQVKEAQDNIEHFFKN